jgi:transposase-like protein
MAKARMDLSTFIGKLLEEHDGDVLREGVRVLAQAIMDTEVTALVGAERHERSDERTAYRNGSRSRTWAQSIWASSRITNSESSAPRCIASKTT